MFLSPKWEFPQFFRFHSWEILNCFGLFLDRKPESFRKSPHGWKDIRQPKNSPAFPNMPWKPGTFTRSLKMEGFSLRNPSGFADKKESFSGIS